MLYYFPEDSPSQHITCYRKTEIKSALNPHHFPYSEGHVVVLCMLATLCYATKATVVNSYQIINSTV